jgi:hypothetical protein
MKNPALIILVFLYNKIENKGSIKLNSQINNLIMKYLIPLIILITLISCKTEEKTDYIEYNIKIEEANYLLFKGDSLRAEKLITELTFKTKRPFLRDIRNLVKLRLELRMYDDIDELVENSFRYGMSKEYLCCDMLISNYYEPIWDDRFPKYPKARERYLNKLDRAYRNTVIELFNEDQKYRTLAKERGRHIDSLRKANDAKVLVKLKELIDDKGYFGFSIIGEDILWGGNCNNFTDVFFRHVEPDSNMMYFHKPLLEALHNGDIYAYSYASAIDHDWIKRDAFTHLYGTLNFQFVGDLYAFPLLDIENIDSLRASVGLIDWARHLEMSGIKYDPTLKPWEW